MSAHTPGSWRVSANSVATVVTDKQIICICEGGEGDGIEPSWDERDSNARLIAAAPDLLAELETINSLACYATEANTSARLDALLEIGKRARAAIAKAETT